MKKIFINCGIALTFILSSIQGFASTANINVNQLTRTFVSETHNLKPQVVKTALTAYKNALKKGVKDKKGIITVIDYTMPSTSKRLWVLDIHHQKVLYNTLVAHGKNTGNEYAKHFSNARNSLETSIGLYQTENTYSGHDGYSLVLKGLDKGFNNNAEARHVIVHGAWYVSQKFADATGRLGRSWGCPAVSKKMVKPIINTIKDKTLLLAYYPNQQWLDSSAYL